MKLQLCALAVLTLAAPAFAANGGGDHDQACAQLKALDQKQKADMQDLEAKIKPLQQQLTTLQEQRKTQAEQHASQRQALVDQIKPGSAAQLKAAEDQRKDLAEKEQAELKAIRDKYAAQRKDIKAPKLQLGCR